VAQPDRARGRVLVTATLARAASRVHFAVGCLVGGLAFLALSLAGLLFAVVFRPLARHAAVVFARAFSVFMRAALGWRIALEEGERLRSAIPAVFVVTHQSNLDIVVFGAVFPPRTAAVGKKELRGLPLFGWFFEFTGNILLDRSDPVRARASIEEAAARIARERISVWMFPEGHRNGRPTLLPFKKGAFHLAVAAQVPIVPIVAEPLWSVLDAARWLVRPGRIRIRVLPPIATAGRTAADVDALIEETRAAMQNARDDMIATARPAIG
jgi:1-acyl-sn-glycerol-3-phosphate acyltransferase